MWSDLVSSYIHGTIRCKEGLWFLFYFLLKHRIINITLWKWFCRCWPFHIEKISLPKLTLGEGNLYLWNLLYIANSINHLTIWKFLWRQKPTEGKGSKLAKRVGPSFIIALIILYLNVFTYCEGSPWILLLMLGYCLSGCEDEW